MRAAAEGWYGKNGKVELYVDVGIAYDGLTPIPGIFQLSTVTPPKLLQGRPGTMTKVIKDADGTRHTHVCGPVLCYDITDGKIDYASKREAIVRCVMTDRGEGVDSVGIRVADYNTGEVIYINDPDLNGLINELPCLSGGVSVSP